LNVTRAEGAVLSDVEGLPEAVRADGHRVPSPLPRLSAVRVNAPARLHLGFLDPSASLGRRFGSLGLVIEGFDTVVMLARATIGGDDDLILAAGSPPGRSQGERGGTGTPPGRSQGEPAPSGGSERSERGGAGSLERHAVARARDVLAALRAATGVRDALTLHIEQVPPAHAGFGTGTQLALAIGRAFATLHGLVLETPALARITGRGVRSGVGVAGFDAGGLLVDAGPGASGGAAPLVARVELPAAWRVLLLLDSRLAGLHGDAERAALAQLAPLSREQAAALCHDTLMQVLPGAMEGDFTSFAAGTNRMQRTLGQHFAPAQGGRAYTSAAVGRVLDALAGARPAAVGQSSWGPTGFAIVPGSDGLDAWLDRARADGLVDAALECRIVQPRARGAVVARLP
jgi:beta-ribofuranosylaminobenzene 5'-phosphate synthase